MIHFIKYVDAFNYRIGRFAMYGIFLMMGILLWSSISKTFFNPSLWTLEMAQFCMVAYYMLGGPYSIQMGSNVRMDLLYGEWDNHRKAQIDAMTIIFLIIYLIFMIWGGWESFMYSLSWRPYIWPIKLIMLFGLSLMLLQSISEFFKDILRIKGHDFGEKN